ncbi:hypothetical protein, partial [Neisseria sicca]|uniref:hypothetical protein n=1 Tax=Neisseria sicca TaxID=490 RepID=UPI001C9A1759
RKKYEKGGVKGSRKRVERRFGYVRIRGFWIENEKGKDDGKDWGGDVERVGDGRDCGEKGEERSRVRDGQRDGEGRGGKREGSGESWWEEDLFVYGADVWL